jgi:hypothetical protein
MNQFEIDIQDIKLNFLIICPKCGEQKLLDIRLYLDIVISIKYSNVSAIAENITPKYISCKCLECEHAWIHNK